ncbi:D-glycerate dehydrogenase [Cytobacillus spongiae]|jgi:glyoxylate reductase|uniref:2-hydroxyacid dehydrogenase n=1 Tax=Cytobacillus spongiae TaxID=2901381 RepID=UPI001F31C4EC|nr:D-glycerate dehydrogenase [Cytobacillus spongiae]UII55409.1 D-glycerate dehydrogenase [Cytobacillus spongiae]
MKPSIYITRKLPAEIIEPFMQRYTVEMWEHEDQSVPYEILLEKAKHVDALLTMLTDPINKQIIDAGQSLKVIANLAVGYDNVDVPAAKERGIVVCNTPNVLTDSTADLTFALLMATSRRILEAANFIKENRWKNWSPLLLAGKDIHHKTVGIVGMGSIGQAVARRASGFDMKIIYYNRARNIEAEQRLGATYASFDELIQMADFVICLTPLTEETKHLFSRDIFKKMKNSAIFVNTSRGPVVDEEALYDALLTGEIAGAGLDVFETEPIGADHPLLTLDNVVALPHIGSSSMETRTAMMNLCVENILAVLDGDPPITPIG